MKISRVLVLGNDPQINSIAFDKLAKDVTTIGVNRIWMKHCPHYFFFHDPEIVSELESDPSSLSNLQERSICYTSDWLANLCKKNGRMLPRWARLYTRPSKSIFPDSVTTAMSIFIRQYPTNVPRVFYIAGVSLKWKEPSHFWKELGRPSHNVHTQSWYTPRFEKVFDNFKKLKQSGAQMISVNSESKLNSIMRYEGIDSLYRKSRQ